MIESRFGVKARSSALSMGPPAFVGSRPSEQADGAHGAFARRRSETSKPKRPDGGKEDVCQSLGFRGVIRRVDQERGRAGYSTAICAETSAVGSVAESEKNWQGSRFQGEFVYHSSR